ncbi:MAG: hypothetical protein ACR2OJ_12955 [Hyphomicrobiales bacterium]
MDVKIANTIIRNLPKDQTLFEYYNDRHAVLLLQRILHEPTPIAALKRTRFAKLLDCSGVKEVVAAKGDGILCPQDLLYVPQIDPAQFVLTLGLWGARKRDRFWHQTSRPGVNLVLQLNFDNAHDRAYERLVQPACESPLNYEDHPVCKKGRTTLAWARIDVDLISGEALIEEIQSDWVRRAQRMQNYAYRLQNERGVQTASELDLWRGDTRIGPLPQFIEYAELVLAPRAQYWQQAMLSAAIWFVTEELGLERIWYHSHQTGAKLKKITQKQPPHSLYSQLPKQFCFEKRCDGPDFIVARSQKRLKKRVEHGKERFWHLTLE